MPTKLTVKPIRRKPAPRRPPRKASSRKAVPRSRRPSALSRASAPASAPSAIAQLPQIEATALRANLSQVVSRVGFGHERIAISRNGQVNLVMLSREDFEHFVRLEAYLDGTEALKALEDFERSGDKSIPSSEVLKRLGIK